MELYHFLDHQRGDDAAVKEKKNFNKRSFNYEKGSLNRKNYNILTKKYNGEQD